MQGTYIQQAAQMFAAFRHLRLTREASVPRRDIQKHPGRPMKA